MTKQEYRNLLVKSATDGTFPSINNNEKLCRYRTKGNKRCAVGLMIPDEEYVFEMEGYSLKGLVSSGLFKMEWLPEDLSIQNLQRIQYLHDELAMLDWDADKFIHRLNEVFNEF